MIYKTDIWTNTGSKWYCGDCRELEKGSNNWYIPCRILNMSPKEFAEMLVLDFDADVKLAHKKIYNQETGEITFGDVLLFYSFTTEERAKKYKLFINNKAKNINYSFG